MAMAGEYTGAYPCHKMPSLWDRGPIGSRVLMQLLGSSAAGTTVVGHPGVGLSALGGFHLRPQDSIAC